MFSKEISTKNEASEPVRQYVEWQHCKGIVRNCFLPPTLSAFLSVPEREKIMHFHVSGDKNSFLIPRSSLRFALKYGNKEPGPLANRVDLALIP